MEQQPLKALEQLGDELERVAFADAQRARSPRPLRRRAILALALMTALLAAAIAVAASGLLTGAPVPNPPGGTFRSDRGPGKPLAARTRMMDLRVDDPAGGPAWGLRTVVTTRNFGCVQIGRVLDGKLGLLGQDGAFSNDGRFHELPPSVLSLANCQQLDGAGNIFLAISYQGMPASALDRGCTTRAVPPLPKAISVPSRSAPLPICPASDERILYYGTLGPQGKSITYKDRQGRHVTVPVQGPSGAYLVVLRPAKGQTPRGGLVSSSTPRSGLISVQYRDGTVCQIRSPRALGGAKPCPLKGYVQPKQPKVTATELRAPVHATVAPKPVRVPGAPAGVPSKLRNWKLTVTFRAPVAAGPGSYYIVSVRPAQASQCNLGSFVPVARDIKVGETVRTPVYLPTRCHGNIHAEVAFHQQHGKPDPIPLAGLPNHDPKLGTADVTLP
jgi:hypothetical protein